jgi:hypothetical protein
MSVASKKVYQNADKNSEQCTICAMQNQFLVPNCEYTAAGDARVYHCASREKKHEQIISIRHIRAK